MRYYDSNQVEHGSDVAWKYIKGQKQRDSAICLQWSKKLLLCTFISPTFAARLSSLDDYMADTVTILYDSSDLVITCGASPGGLPSTSTIIRPDRFLNDTILWFNSTANCWLSNNEAWGSLALFGYAFGDVSQSFILNEGSPGERSVPNPLHVQPIKDGSPQSSPGQWLNLTADPPMMSGINNMSIDYALAIPKESTNMLGQTIFVDDGNPEIVWTAGWEVSDYDGRSSEYFQPLLDGVSISPKAHGNATHSSNKIGETFTFKFAGTSMQVVGFKPVNFALDSAFVMTFDIDGNTTTQHYFQQDNPYASGIPHFVYFSTDSLQSGNHVFTANITENVGNTSAFIDYLSYKASFSLLSEKPDFQDASNSSNGTNPMGNTPSAGSNPPKSTNIAAIIGGCIGGVTLLALLGFGFWYLRRRKLQQRRHSLHSQRTEDIVEPFTIPVPNTRATSTKRSITNEKTFRVPEPDEPGRLFWQDSSQHPPTHPSNSNHEYSSVQNDLHPMDSVSNVSAQELQHDEAVAQRIRNLEAQIGIMNQEMNRYIVPPGYTSQNASVVGRREGNV
ncbi:hypothetical protein K435DRAFT_858349 [Dendrothele bispora CBS 962.96]|uniref:Uncharacterized protein n=1 Tax=Dendrothele bispora (strain CBS 962.96) TaxID=1314807 RepID=A0A4S8M3Y1_DENBC|nr:hypothetical protein K435DRAFT_858349 [Dendrothele bispora CBS 962.96]